MKLQSRYVGVFCVVASSAAMGCNSGSGPVGTTSLTGAEVVAGSPVPSSEGTVDEGKTCESSSGEGADVCETSTTAVRPAGAPLAATPPTRKLATAHHAASFRQDGVSLDEAIRREAERIQDERATESATTELVGDPVTTTGATVPVATTTRPARVVFVDQLEGQYRLERVRMLVDGAVAFDGPHAGTLTLPPGDHLVEVVADYRLHDSIFSYVDGYQVEMRSSRNVTASDGGIDLVATARPMGGVTTPVGQRAGLAWSAAIAR